MKVALTLHGREGEGQLRPQSSQSPVCRQEVIFLLLLISSIVRDQNDGCDLLVFGLPYWFGLRSVMSTD